MYMYVCITDPFCYTPKTKKEKKMNLPFLLIILPIIREMFVFWPNFDEFEKLRHYLIALS